MPLTLLPCVPHYELLVVADRSEDVLVVVVPRHVLHGVAHNPALTTSYMTPAQLWHTCSGCMMERCQRLFPDERQMMAMAPQHSRKLPG